MNKIKAIFSDFDGTLLNDDKYISETDLNTIRKIKESGIYFIGATGRHFPIARKYAKEIGTEQPFILCNGGLIYDYNTEMPLKVKYIDSKLIAPLVDFAIENNLNCYAYIKEGVYIRGDNPDKAFYERVKNMGKSVCDGELMISDVASFTLDDKDIIKFLLPSCPNDKFEALLQTDIAKSGKLEIAFSGENFLDINLKGANKGNALLDICAGLNIDSKDTIAMGDNFNDIEMLKVCGIAVSPQNAEEEVKKYADLITTSCNENPLTNMIKLINQKYGKIIDVDL